MIPSGLPGMNLSTRLTIAMVSLVLLTAAAVGYLSYRNLEATILPTELTRLDARAHLHATVLNSYVHSARSDVLMATAPASLDGLLRAYHGGGIDPTDGTPQTVWRDRFAKYLVTQLAVKPEYLQSRLIGIADGGREIIRADRAGPEGAVRLAPDSELQKKGDRDYFKETIRLAAGKVYISPIELNQEHGVIETPHVPVMRVATPVFGVDGKLFGIIAINIDMRPALAQLRQSAPVAGRIYAVNENGNYLINPDASREFGFALGKKYRLQDDFPTLAPVLASGEGGAREAIDASGQNFAIATTPVRLAGGPRVTVVEAVPMSAALASAATIRQSSLIAGLIAALCAAVFAAVTARSLVRPLTSLTRSLEHFTGEETTEIPERASGEIGVLARTLKRMADAVREKTATIRQYAEREKLYIAAVESANDAIFTSKLDGTLTSWNPAAAKLFGYSAEEAIGHNVSIIAMPEQRAEQKKYLELVARGERIENLEAVRVTKAGTLIDVSFNFSPVFSDSGEVIGGSAIARDITERKLADAMFHTAVESSPGAMVMADASGKIILVNAETERMFGYAHGELVGMSIETLIPKKSRGVHVQHRNSYAAHPSRRIGSGRDLLGVRKDGSELNVEVGLNPIMTRKGLVVLAAVVDITERKKHEKAMAEQALELQRSNAELEQFAYVASHDLQEPLRMVASYAELLAERYQGKLDDKADKYIAYAVDGAKRMQRLVNDLLTYSRVGTQGHAPQPTDANIVAGHVLRTLKGKIDESGAQVEIGSLPVVNADEGQLGQVFQNLIGNALKFRSEQPLRVRVGARPSPQGWVFYVEDNGIGIESQYTERVFQMFQRLHDRDSFEGSGIGLTIAKKIVERHGGRIWFESEPGKGTTFFFTLSATQEKAA